MASVYSAFSGCYSIDLKKYGEMRTCQMDTVSSGVFDKALALGWIVESGMESARERKNRKS